jgi:hypothetical protein
LPRALNASRHIYLSEKMSLLLFQANAVVSLSEAAANASVRRGGDSLAPFFQKETTSWPNLKDSKLDFSALQSAPKASRALSARLRSSASF